MRCSRNLASNDERLPWRTRRQSSGECGAPASLNATISPSSTRPWGRAASSGTWFVMSSRAGCEHEVRSRSVPCAAYRGLGHLVCARPLGDGAEPRAALRTAAPAAFQTSHPACACQPCGGPETVPHPTDVLAEQHRAQPDRTRRAFAPASVANGALTVSLSDGVGTQRPSRRVSRDAIRGQGKDAPRVCSPSLSPLGWWVIPPGALCSADAGTSGSQAALNLVTPVRPWCRACGSFARRRGRCAVRQGCLGRRPGRP